MAPGAVVDKRAGYLVVTGSNAFGYLRERSSPQTDHQWRGRTMTVLVAYASKYGGTRGIAERIADVLNASGVNAVAQSVTSATELRE